MALTYSLDDFTVSFFVTGNGFSVLSVEVYAMARKGISMEINAISTMSIRGYFVRCCWLLFCSTPDKTQTTE
jgi:ABC-type spermidine/putrescine transport system permease subunit II